MTQAAPRRWPGYAAIWRWHFYAGLLCIPFVLWLATTGSLYLFRPQVEAMLDRPFAGLTLTGNPASASAQARAAVAAVPGSALRRYQLPRQPADAAQVIVGAGEREVRVYVHPQTLRILKAIDEDARPFRLISRLHGQLLLGDAGSCVVELAASWAIVMILSGLFLWWPRGRGAAGVLYPRLRGGRRQMWRDLHGVTGFWVSFCALFLLLSGLPWSAGWGAYLKAARTVAEGSVGTLDWTTSRREELAARSGHGDHGMAMARPASDPAQLDRVTAAVRPLGLAAPVLIAPPAGPGMGWSAKSDAANRPLRADVLIDGASGRILSRTDFADRRLVDRVVGTGVAAHEGQLFGWANQMLGLLTAIGLVLMSVSAVVLWWRRRPAGTLGAPPPPRQRLAVAFFATVALIGLLLPMFGLSLIAVALLDGLVLRRSTPVARWLGLRGAAA